MVPVALDAEALELLALHVEPVLGIGAAFLAERDHRRGVGEVRLRLALGAVVLLLDLPFDRQAVAVPARHVVGVVAEHLLAARHHVLEDLVERVADMDVAVGVGRAVVQDEFRRGPWRPRAAARRGRSSPSAPGFPAPSAAGRRASGNRSAAGTGSRNNRVRACVAMAVVHGRCRQQASGLLIRRKGAAFRRVECAPERRSETPLPGAAAPARRSACAAVGRSDGRSSMRRIRSLDAVEFLLVADPADEGDVDGLRRRGRRRSRTGTPRAAARRRRTSAARPKLATPS